MLPEEQVSGGWLPKALGKRAERPCLVCFPLRYSVLEAVDMEPATNVSIPGAPLRSLVLSSLFLWEYYAQHPVLSVVSESG
jgi:hypothetical protein